MNRKLQIVLSLVTIALLFNSFNASAWQGETPNSPDATNASFTYQGYLEDSAGKPITDTCDFRFKLFSVLYDGTQVGADSEIIGIDVEDGIFTTRVNIYNEFGASAFSGGDRYLAVAVKCTHDTEYLSLGQRQRLTAAPYASYALVAGKVSNQNPYVLTLSPFSAVPMGSITDFNILPQTNGAVLIEKTSSGEGAGGVRLVGIPISTISHMYGSAFTVDSLKVCYRVQDAANGFITGVGVQTGNGQGTNLELVESLTDRTSTTHTCFNVPATGQGVLNSAYVVLALSYTGVGTPDITIYEVSLELGH